MTADGFFRKILGLGALENDEDKSSEDGTDGTEVTVEPSKPLSDLEAFKRRRQEQRRAAAAVAAAGLTDAVDKSRSSTPASSSSTSHDDEVQNLTGSHRNIPLLVFGTSQAKSAGKLRPHRRSDT
jgi:hypothetical protein